MLTEFIFQETKHSNIRKAVRAFSKCIFTIKEHKLLLPKPFILIFCFKTFAPTNNMPLFYHNDLCGCYALFRYKKMLIE